MRDNICEIVIGRGTLKWDAAWRIIEWLANPEAGHGLGSKFRDELVMHCFQSAPETVELAVEYYLGKDDEGRSRHPDIAIASPSFHAPEKIALIDDLGNVSPNNSRKINNLIAYDRLAATKFPEAERSVVVITDTTSIDRFTRLTSEFSSIENASLVVLPLYDLGRWISDSTHCHNQLVHDFVEWTGSLE
ncbi:MAG: hypothetical protein ABJ084_00980 [Halioglobus sp.]